MSQHNNKIEKILQSLEGVGKLQAPDFFYTRLHARMEKEMLQQPKQFILVKPAFLASCLLVAFAFNIITLVNNKNETTQLDTGTATIESFATEYNLVSTDPYQ